MGEFLEGNRGTLFNVRTWLRSTNGIIFIVLTLAFALRLAYIIINPAEITPGDDPEEYLKWAKFWAGLVPHPPFHTLDWQPPLYSFFISLIFRIAGYNIDLVRIVQSILAIISCLAIYKIGELIKSRVTGLIAMTIFALHPYLIHYSVQIYSEQIFTFLLIMGVLCLFWAELKDSPRWLFACGAILGLSVWAREAGAIFILGTVFFYIIFWRNISYLIRRWLMILIPAFLVILPWTIRNYIIFGEFIPFSTNGGVNFYVGNNPKATGHYDWVLPAGVQWDKESPKGFYELQAMRLGYSQGFQYIKNNPLRSVELIFKRIYYLMRPSFFTINLSENIAVILSKIIWVILDIVLLISTFFISFIMLRRDYRLLSLILTFMLLLALPYLVTFGSLRYRIPMVPFMALITALTIDNIYSSKKMRFALLPNVD